ncbi:MAG: tRNA pseudouridine(13) synthase TruD [Planctomycetota bacterium]|nr:tRNA pseudouridine(13) synthase TruD [Planctomycetota bacterium]
MTKPIRPVMPEPPQARVDGRYKVRSEDFGVIELPAYLPSGDGTHTFVWMEKQGLSTLDAIRVLAEATGTQARDYGYAGLKDAQAVTRQWISIEHADPAAFRDLELDAVRVLEVGQHGNKLKPGHLLGNRFSILLRGAAAEQIPHLRANLEWCSTRGVPNYFGEQRFGKRGSNLDQGLAILRDPKPKQKSYKFAPRILKLLLSAVQSEVFNRVLRARIESFDQLQDGDLAWIHDTGASFTVDDVAAERPRCDAFEISPTGPIPGPKMLRAKAEPGALEDRVMAEMDLSFDAFGFSRAHRGGRRSLRLPVTKPVVEEAPDGARVEFELPSGSYATSVLRLLLVDPPWFG